MFKTLKMFKGKRHLHHTDFKEFYHNPYRKSSESWCSLCGIDRTFLYLSTDFTEFSWAYPHRFYKIFVCIPTQTLKFSWVYPHRLYRILWVGVHRFILCGIGDRHLYYTDFTEFDHHPYRKSSDWCISLDFPCVA